MSQRLCRLGRQAVAMSLARNTKLVNWKSYLSRKFAKLTQRTFTMRKQRRISTRRIVRYRTLSRRVSTWRTGEEKENACRKRGSSIQTRRHCGGVISRRLWWRFRRHIGRQKSALQITKTSRQKEAMMKATSKQLSLPEFLTFSATAISKTKIWSSIS